MRLFFLLILLCFRCWAPCEIHAQGGMPDHSIWTNELRKYVTYDGYVKYYHWSQDRKGLDDYLIQLSKNPVQNEWSKDEKLAYWINAYNAFTVKLVLSHFPIKSIRDINRGKPWDEKWIRLGTEVYSLHQIENEIIRPQFSEPRVHFALNCASMSCPPLLNEAFVAEKLEAQLNERAVSFINDQRYNEITLAAAKISQIFKWYQADFGSDGISFLNQYSKIKLDPGARVEFLPYNWALNEK